MVNDNKANRVIAKNKKAWHDYFVEEQYETGIALYGTEVKSIRAGRINLKDSYCSIRNGELFAIGVHISPYEKGNINNKPPLRDKKLLMHKREIVKLNALVNQKGYTLVPLTVYFSGSNVKVCVGLCKGKKMYDKRAAEMEKEASKEIDRNLKDASRRR